MSLAGVQILQLRRSSFLPGNGNRGLKGKNRVNFFRKKKFLQMKGFLFLFLAYFSDWPPYFCHRKRGGTVHSFCLYILILPFSYFRSFPLKAMERNFILRIAVQVLLVTGFMGCSTKEELPVAGTGKVSVNFSLEGMKSKAKAADESLLKDVNIYVVNSEGAVAFYHYAEGASNIKADIWSGQSFTVYAVANAGRRLMAASEDEILQLEMDWGMVGEDVLPMSGKYGPAILSDGGSIVVPLTRSVAKVELNGDMSGLNDDVSIKVKQVRLRNVPVKGSFFGQDRIEELSGAKDGEPLMSGDADAGFPDGICFYMPENMQGTLLPGNTSQKDKVWPQGSLYAGICTYVEIVADYESDKKEGEIVYRFYLGADAYSNYDVQRNTRYIVTVSFKGDGGIDENSWRVDVEDLDDVIPPKVEFAREEAVMYDLEESIIPFAAVEGKWELKVESSDPSVVQVVGYDRGGVKLKALAPGTATVIARIGKAGAECTIDVEKLRIVPRYNKLELYNHFYEDVQYDIQPAHASGFGVKVSSSSVSLVTGYNGVGNRVIPQYPTGFSHPVEEKIELKLEGRKDVSAVVEAVVNPMLKIRESIVVNANLGSSATVKDLGLSTAPRATVHFYWAGNDRVSIYGDPGDNIVLDKHAGTATFPIPNSANGTYRLIARVTGDDGYGATSTVDTDAAKYCDITVYETVYLVGVSKTMGKERVSASPEIWKYSNEVVAKWLAHPRSVLFPNGEVDVDYGFVYNGVTYTDSHTDLHEEFRFTFVKGDYIDYIVEGPKEFKGSIPEYYLDYFYLQPAVSPYINGNMREGTKFLYITSLQFAKGFSDDDPGWEKIFNFIYY